MYSKIQNLPFQRQTDNNCFSYDSLKVRIPIKEVEIISPYLKGNYVLVCKESGEAFEEEEFKKNSHMHSNGYGVKTYYRIEFQYDFEDKGVNEFLTILLTSKILEKDYFKGITKETIKLIYDKLISQKMCFFNFSSLENALCTDIDVKYDFESNIKPVDLVGKLYDCAKLKKRSIEGCSDYRRSTNTGIQYAMRKTNTFKTAPYLKFYAKLIELKNKSVKFYNAYLKGGFISDNLVRMETTIKGKKHLDYLGAKSNTLIYLLDNIDIIAQRAFKHALKVHIDIDMQNKQNLLDKARKVNVNDKAFIYVIADYVENKNYGIEEAIEEVSEVFTSDRKLKYKLKNRLYKIFEEIEYKKQSDDDLKAFLNFVKDPYIDDGSNVA